MASPRQEIIRLPMKIASILTKDGKIERKVLISHLRLTTGFSPKTLDLIIEDMIILGKIEEKNGFVGFVKDEDKTNKP